MRHIPLASQADRRYSIPVADMRAILRDEFGITPATAIRFGGALGDAEDPDDPVVSQTDLDRKRGDEYERWVA